MGAVFGGGAKITVQRVLPAKVWCSLPFADALLRGVEERAELWCSLNTCRRQRGHAWAGAFKTLGAVGKTLRTVATQVPGLVASRETP